MSHRNREVENDSFLFLKPDARSLMPVFYHHPRSMAKDSTGGPLSGGCDRSVGKPARCVKAPGFPPSFLSCIRGRCIAGKRRHDWRRPERPAGSGIEGMGPEKIDRIGFAGSKTPKGACILHFSKRFYPLICRGNSCSGEGKFTEMLKKLDYERILGYTSTDFESGG